MPQRRLLPDRHGGQVRATIDLVAPLAHEATDMRNRDTTSHQQDRDRSRAVTPPIGASLRPGDVESANGRRTPTTAATRGCRTSTMATRIGTTSRTDTARVSSADQCHPGHAGYSFEDLVAAYFDCRRNKRNKATALAFEENLETNLVRLDDELRDGTYRPGRTVCFIITRPKPREVWAAEFRDRIVHHLLYNHIADRFHNAFIADSCACIPGRGTLYAAQRLESKVRSITQNWKRPARYLKCDIANFFVSIDKRRLFDLLRARIHEPWWLSLAELILFHDPREGVALQVSAKRLALIPPHKSLFNQPAHKGLPIGNLSSQFFANVYLNELDQFVKHRLKSRHYVRYVDDFILLHESAQWLNQAHDAIREFLIDRLDMKLNDSKTIRQPVDRGIDFVGHMLKPHRRTLRRRTFNDALHRVRSMPADDLYNSVNSYFGLLRQATRSRRDRIRLAKLVMDRGHAVDGKLTKTFRAASQPGRKTCSF